MQGVLNSQYTYQEGRLSCQLRSALSGLVFRKALLVGSCHLGGHGPGNVQTLMSVDANRCLLQLLRASMSQQHVGMCITR